MYQWIGSREPLQETMESNPQQAMGFLQMVTYTNSGKALKAASRVGIATDWHT